MPKKEQFEGWAKGDLWMELERIERHISDISDQLTGLYGYAAEIREQISILKKKNQES